MAVRVDDDLPATLELAAPGVRAGLAGERQQRRQQGAGATTKPILS
jgi:hypothetical protein